MTDRRDDDFTAVAEDLTAVLSDLRDELEDEAPRGPLGLPKPPSPGDVLRFTDEVAIPGTIAILEVNIKLLETVQRAIRLAESGRNARSRTDDATARMSDSAGRLADASDRTLNRLEQSLSDLQTVLERGPTPEGRAGEELLEEARALRDDVQSRLRDARTQDLSLSEFEDRAEDADRERQQHADDAAQRVDEKNTDAAAESEGSGSSSGGTVQVDVDAELETLKEHYGTDEDRDPDTADSGGDDDNGPDGDDGTPSDGDGTDADTGTDGTDTDPGTDGTDADPGTDGTDADTGTDGTDADTGTDGAGTGRAE